MNGPHGQHDVDQLWRDYKGTGERHLRDRLVLQYSPLVKYVAGRVRSGLPPNVDGADLTSEGLIGLIDAIDRFEPERGLQFQTYAVPRIRGAILDSLRAADWVPRTVRAQVRAVEKAQATLAGRLGRAPTDAELAAELGVSRGELRKIYGSISYTGVASLEEIGVPDDFAPLSTDDMDDEMREALVPSIRQLPERDQVIIALYYFEGLTLSEIGQVLGVTESRVSQLHTRATLALRRSLLASAA